jgi:hypothetical protein
MRLEDQSSDGPTEWRDLMSNIAQDGWRRLVALAFGVALVAGTAASAAAGPIVDSTALEPPPPPGTACRDDGPLTICTRETVDSWTLVPIFPLPCGQLYESAVDARDARRWYRDGKLVKRRVVQDAQATWTLSPTGSGPAAEVGIHANWIVVLAVPGDESTGSLTAHGNFATVHLPGAGGELHISGLDLPDGTHRGVFRFVDEPDAVEALCAALGS